MKTAFYIICILAQLSAGGFLQAEETTDLIEAVFKDSPRLAYLEKRLLSRASTHSVVQSQKEKITNPFLIKEGIFFNLDELQSQRVKFFILKEIRQIIRNLQRKEKEKQIFQEVESHFSPLISGVQKDTHPQANLWLKKGEERLEKKLEKTEAEKDFYLELLKDKLKTSALPQEIRETPSKIFEKINPGFEVKIEEKRAELLDWENLHLLESREKYPHLSRYLNISTNLPYLFFPFPLPKTQGREIHNQLYEIEKLKINLDSLEKRYEKEEISLSRYYALKKKEGLQSLLKKIKEIAPTSLSFENLVTAKKLYLDYLISKADIESELESLKEEGLRFAGLSEYKTTFFIPDLSEITKFALENSLTLKIREKELFFLEKMITLSHEILKDYFASCYEYRKNLYEEEKSDLAREIMRNWHQLVLTYLQWKNQGELRNLSKAEYYLYLNSPQKTAFEKKWKELSLLEQDIHLHEKEKEVALEFLKLKASLKSIAPEKHLEIATGAVSFPSLEKIKSEIENLSFSSDHSLKEKIYQSRKMREEKELRLLEKSQIVKTLSKENIIAGKFDTPFLIQITETMPKLSKLSQISKIRDFLVLREKIFSEEEKKEDFLNAVLLKETKKILSYLENRISEEERLLKELEDNPLNKDEKILNQKIRTLYKKQGLIKIMRTYLTDLGTSRDIKSITLHPPQEKKLLELLSPILDKERIQLLSLKRKKDSYADYVNYLIHLDKIKKLYRDHLRLLSILQKNINKFTLKRRIGLVTAEDLSSIHLLKDKLNTEIYLLIREHISLKKSLPISSPRGKPDLLRVFLSGKESRKLKAGALKTDPVLKLINLELNRFTSPDERDFLNLLKKEREKELKDTTELLLKGLPFQARIWESAQKQHKTSEEILSIGLKDLQEENLWLYGEYGFNSIFLKYIEDKKELEETFSEFNLNKAKLSQLLSAPQSREGFNYFSLFPLDPSLIGVGKVYPLGLEGIQKQKEFIPDFSLEKSAPSDSEGLQDQTRREFGRFCRVSQILQMHKIVRSKNPGLPRKIGKSSSDLPNDPFGANFAIAKFGIIRSIKEKWLALPLLEKERAKRRELYKIENYNRNLHAWNFSQEEKKKAPALKENLRVLELAHEKEFQMEKFLDRLFSEEKEFKEGIRKKLRAKEIDISEEVSLLLKELGINENKELWELFFIQYGERFRIDAALLKDCLRNLAYVYKEFKNSGVKLKRLPSWWAKYTDPILSYPEKSYLEETTNLTHLGLYLYYAQLRRYLDKTSPESFVYRLKRDYNFLTLDLKNLSKDEVEAYLAWESEIKKELDQLTLSSWSKEEWEEKRKILVKVSEGFLGFLWGSLKERALQDDFLTWLIASGVEEKDYPQLLKLIKEISAKIRGFFPPLKPEEKLSLYEAVRLRWLASSKEEEALKEEESKQEEAIFQGNLLFWTGFFWKKKIELDEIKLFFSFMAELQEQPDFKDIFGQPRNLSNPQTRFYLGSLSYWTEILIDEFRKGANLSKAKEHLCEKLKRFRFIYRLKSFQKIYGPLDLSLITLETEEEKLKAKEFLGKLGFFLSWSEEFNMDEKELLRYFEDLESLITLKTTLENFYKNQGLNIIVDLANPVLKEEGLGIISSWLQFFYRRGIKEKEAISQALKEMEFIQKMSQENNLNLNMDEIRYWWERKKLKEYDFEFLRKLFKNIAQLKTLAAGACESLIQKLNNSSLKSWESESLRKEMIQFIEKRKNTSLDRAEVQNLAEKTIPTLGLDFAKLKEEYAERLYLEATYSVYRKEELSPKKLSALWSVMKDRGYSLWEMGDFIYLYALLKDNKSLSSSSATDLELYGFLNNLFNQNPPYDEKTQRWIDVSSVLQKYFYAEHQRYLDFSLLKTLTNYALLRLRTWQIRLLVERGKLNRNSHDRELRALENDYLNFKRFILRVFWENQRRILPEKDILKFYKIAKDLNLSEEEKRIVLKKIIESVSQFQNNLSILLSQVLYEKNLSAEYFLNTSEKISASIIKDTFPYLLQYTLNEEATLKDRRNQIMKKRRLSPLIERKSPHSSVQREISAKELSEKAGELYGKEISTHKSSALVWKVLEGLSIEEVLKIYVEDYGKIENLYTQIFQKQTLGIKDREIILYLSEEINLGFLTYDLIEELFNLGKVIKTKIKENLNQELSIQETLDYAWPSLYAGMTPQVLESIFIQARLIRKRIEGILLSEELKNRLNTDILYLLGQIYGIPWIEKINPPYELSEYIGALDAGTSYLNIKEKEINEEGQKNVAANLRISFLPPQNFLFMVRDAEHLHNFLKENLNQEVSGKEILLYLDHLNKDALSFLNLEKISDFYFSPRINKIKIEKLLELSFKKFLEKNLN